MKQRFREDTAGTIRFAPPEGPPITAATVALYNPDGSALQAAAAATLPTVATTLNGALAAGARTVTLTSNADCVSGGDIWIGTVGTDRLEQCRIRSVDAANVVTLTEPTLFAHETGETVKGSELTYSLTTTHTATKDQNYRALWSYTVGSTAYTAEQVFDIVASVFRLLLSPSTLRTRISDNLRRSAPSAFDMREVISEAEADIMRELVRVGRRPDCVRDPDQLAYLGVLGVERILLRRAGMTNPAMLQQVQVSDDDWRSEFGRLMAAGLSWYDEDQDLSVDNEDDLDEESLQTARYGVLG